MEPRVKQGLILGAIVGVLVAAVFIGMTGVWACLLLIPFCAVMGAAPQMLKPADDDDDDD